MDGCKKVATFLLALDPKVASDLLGRFESDEKTEVAEAMMGMPYVDQETVDQVLTEFEQAASRGFAGTSKANLRAILETTLGKGRVDGFLKDAGRSGSWAASFDALGRLEPEPLAKLLAGELPQTITIVLSHLEPPKAGAVLAQLPKELALDIVHRMVSGDQAVAPTVLESIGRALETQATALTSSSASWATSERRYQLIADLLNAAPRAVSDAALEVIRRDDPRAGEELRVRMFPFEDLPLLNVEGLRKVLGAVEQRTVALALKTASAEVKDCVFRSLSKRAGQTVREELEMLGLQPLSEVEKAQRAILAVVNKLVDAGDIVINRGAQEQMV